MPSGTVAPIDDVNFTALLHQATPKLHSFVRRLVGNAADADDVLQEALGRAWRLRHSFDAGHDNASDDNSSDDNVASARAWLQRIAFRVFCDLRAKKKRQPSDSDTIHHYPAPDAPCPTELRDEVAHRLQALPEIERTLLLGFHSRELSLRELAAKHNLPINTIKSHLHRARQRLHSARRNRFQGGQE